ncbi:MAG TPA: hypothetical protein ENJ45_04375, partial [Phaeodactylibacter sp.]|nr:hypothetical protein [Phaeodactylibacter sp.]
MRFLTLLLLTLSFSILSAQQTVRVSQLNEAPKVIVEKSALFGQVAIRNLVSLNSNDMDYSPLLYKGGLVFTSTRKYEGQENKWFKSHKKKFAYLFFAAKDKRGHYLTPKPLKGAINGKYHEGAACFNKEGDVMFFTRNNNKGKNKFGKVELKIYTARLKN